MTNKNKLVILIDRNLYSLEAIYGASYVFLEKAYIQLKKNNDSEIKIFLKSKKPMKKSEIDNLGDEFMNELLNFSFKNQIAQNNKKIREYIIGRALASALPTNTLNNRKQEFPRHGLIKQNFMAQHWDKDMLDKEFNESMSGKIKTNLCLTSDKKTNDALIKEPIWEKDPEGIAVPWKKIKAPKKR